jgi:hypothetical protein
MDRSPTTRRRWGAGVLFALVVLVLIGATGTRLRSGAAWATGAASPAASPSPTLHTLDDVVAALRGAGLAAEATEATVAQPFFAIPAQVVRVDGQELQVFVYPSEAARRSDSDQISPNGRQVGTSVIAWVAPPHFTTAANVLVLLVSTDEELARRVGQAVTGLAPAEDATPVASPKVARRAAQPLG